MDKVNLQSVLLNRKKECLAHFKVNQGNLLIVYVFEPYTQFLRVLSYRIHTPIYFYPLGMLSVKV